MTLLRTISVSPLPSYASRPDGVPTVRHSPSVPEMARMIWSWSRGRHALTRREQFLEQRLIEEIAQQLDLGLDSAEVSSIESNTPPRGRRAF